MNYKEDSREETQDRHANDTYDIEIEETLDKAENSATEEEFEVEVDGEELQEVAQQSQEAHIEVLQGSMLRSPKMTMLMCK